jgi:hypothetical protein
MPLSHFRCKALTCGQAVPTGSWPFVGAGITLHESRNKRYWHDARRRWLSARAAQAASYGKPFVIEEFGKYIPRPATNDEDIKRIRDPWFEDVFSIVDGSIKSGGPIHGEFAVPRADCALCSCVHPASIRAASLFAGRGLVISCKGLVAPCNL